ERYWCQRNQPRTSLMNPAEYLQTLPTDLLGAMARGEIDAQAVAARLMADRGLDQQGDWVGFAQAAVVWGIKKAV
ncbi:MAG: hypothetical protein Q7J74_12990, partial [Pseudomonas sp.]|nr:hypothetical protein [Pseudomonas sp.]